MTVRFGGGPFAVLLVSVAVFVVSVLGIAEVMTAGLFWSHLGLLFQLMASGVFMLVSFGAMVQDKERK